MGALKASLEQWEEALKYLEPLAQRSPDFQQAHVQLALVYQRLGRPVDSRREREIVKQLDDRQQHHEGQSP